MKTKVTQSWKLNNEALKFFRDFHGENPRGYPCGPIELTSKFIHQIGVMTKTRDGTDQSMDYGWQPVGTTPWSWLQMLRQLPPEKLAQIVGANHICRITLEPVPNSYDIKRHHAAKKCKTQKPFPAGARAPIWDFHVLTSDGEVHRFHPEWGKRKAPTERVLGVATDLPAPPDAGIGGSDGPGTYRRITSGAYENRRGYYTPTQSTVVEASGAITEERPHIVAGVQSTVVEASEDGQPVVLAIEDGQIVDPGCDDAVPVAESTWPLFDKQVHKAVALQESRLPVRSPHRTWSNGPEYTPASSSGWWSGGGWSSAWQTGWNAGWQTGWKQQ